ncbi:hypothetical protein LKK83_13510 [Phormidium sp. CCY1219]|nr:hypothetical protein [Phormidium sp. CCY1219]
MIKYTRNRERIAPQGRSRHASAETRMGSASRVKHRSEGKESAPAPSFPPPDPALGKPRRIQKLEQIHRSDDNCQR